MSAASSENLEKLAIGGYVMPGRVYTGAFCDEVSDARSWESYETVELGRFYGTAPARG